jgi:hypothetical protein
MYSRSQKIHAYRVIQRRILRFVFENLTFSLPYNSGFTYSRDLGICRRIIHYVRISEASHHVLSRDFQLQKTANYNNFLELYTYDSDND